MAHGSHGAPSSWQGSALANTNPAQTSVNQWPARDQSFYSIFHILHVHISLHSTSKCIFSFFGYLGICLDSLAHNLQFKFLSASRRNPLPWPEAGSVHALYEMDSVIRDLMTKGNPNPRIVWFKQNTREPSSKYTLFSLHSLHTCRSHTDPGPIRQSPHLERWNLSPVCPLHRRLNGSAVPTLTCAISLSYQPQGVTQRANFSKLHLHFLNQSLGKLEFKKTFFSFCH